MKNENKIVIEFLIFCFLNANEGINVLRLFPEFIIQRLERIPKGILNRIFSSLTFILTLFPFIIRAEVPFG